MLIRQILLRRILASQNHVGHDIFRAHLCQAQALLAIYTSSALWGNSLG